jgi:hypothetical protein
MGLDRNCLGNFSYMGFKHLFQGEMTKKNNIEIPLCSKHVTSSLNIVICESNQIRSGFTHVDTSLNEIILEGEPVAAKKLLLFGFLQY